MAEPPASLVVPALVRTVAAAGGFATVLNRGSAGGSAWVLVHRTPGAVRAFERVASLDGGPQWRLAGEGEAAVARFLERMARLDPEYWAVELDVADPARFVPGFRHTG
jgi:hypothetical protein